MSEKPKICPFLTIANSQIRHKDGRMWECEEENCALWCEWTKCCALVQQAQSENGNNNNGGSGMRDIEADLHITNTEIKQLKAELDRYKQLERDERLVELPCKVGDTVYVLPHYQAYWDDIEATKIVGVTQYLDKRDTSNQIVTSLGLCYSWKRDFGVSLFLTLEEAEAALKGE